MKSSEFKIYISVESYGEKTAENYRKCYVAEKCIISNYRRYRPKLKVQIEDFNEGCVKL